MDTTQDTPTPETRRRAHTPGPWATSDDPNCGDGLNILDAAGRGVAHTSAVRNMGGKSLPADRVIEADEAHANARLIAAAPELLDALKGVVGLVQMIAIYRDRPDLQQHFRYVDAEAAIAMAEGK